MGAIIKKSQGRREVPSLTLRRHEIEEDEVKVVRDHDVLQSST